MKICYAILVTIVLGGCTSMECYESKAVEEILKRDFKGAVTWHKLIPISVADQVKYEELEDPIIYERPDHAEPPPPPFHNKKIKLDRRVLQRLCITADINESEFNELKRKIKQYGKSSHILCNVAQTSSKTFQEVLSEKEIDVYQEVAVPIELDDLIVLYVNTYNGIKSEGLRSGNGHFFVYRKQDGKWVRIDLILKWIA